MNMFTQKNLLDIHAVRISTYSWRINR